MSVKKVTPAVAVLCLKMRYDFEFRREFVKACAESANNLEGEWFGLGEMKNLVTFGSFLTEGFEDIDVSESVGEWSAADILHFLKLAAENDIVRILFTYVDTIKLLNVIDESMKIAFSTMSDVEAQKTSSAISDWFKRAFKTNLLHVK